MPRYWIVLLSVMGKRLSASMGYVLDQDVSDHESILAFARFDIFVGKSDRKSPGSSAKLMTDVCATRCLAQVLLSRWRTVGISHLCFFRLSRHGAAAGRVTSSPPVDATEHSRDDEPLRVGGAFNGKRS